jgi:protein-S-isoprenylcysteine O-methyltransferase Ste14
VKGGLFDLIYLGCFVLIAAVRVAGVWSARRPRGGLRKPMPKMNLDTFMTMLQSLGLFFLPFIYLFSNWLDWANYHLPVYLGWAGTLLYLFGVWILWQTHRDLGANWSDSLEIQEHQGLVTSGIYARIRHPMYTAHLVAALGQCLLLGNWIAGPSFLVLQLPFYMVRIPAEEKLLLEHFGEEYQTYIRHTGRLLPKW